MKSFKLMTFSIRCRGHVHIRLYIESEEFMWLCAIPLTVFSKGKYELFNVDKNILAIQKQHVFVATRRASSHDNDNRRWQLTS